MPNIIVNSLSLIHTSDISISIISIRKQSMTSPLGLAKTKQREFFFVCAYVALYVAGLTSFLCFAFDILKVFPYMYIFYVLAKICVVISHVKLKHFHLKYPYIRFIRNMACEMFTRGAPNSLFCPGPYFRVSVWACFSTPVLNDEQLSHRISSSTVRQ